jgi:hypothetical protein
MQDSFHIFQMCGWVLFRTLSLVLPNYYTVLKRCLCHHFHSLSLCTFYTLLQANGKWHVYAHGPAFQLDSQARARIRMRLKYENRIYMYVM